MYVCTSYMYSVFIGQKTMLDPLEAELKMAVSLCVGAGDQTGFSGKAASALILLSHLSRLSVLRQSRLVKAGLKSPT